MSTPKTDTIQPDTTLPKVPAYSFKEYTALLTQSGTSAPTAVILANTLLEGEESIVWTRAIQGQYSGTLVGKFPEAKTTCIMSNYIGSGNNSCSLNRASDDLVYIRCYNSAGALTDGLLSSTMVQIKVYN